MGIDTVYSCDKCGAIAEEKHDTEYSDWKIVSINSKYLWTSKPKVALDVLFCGSCVVDFKDEMEKFLGKEL
jgi:hypothetical protein